LRLGHRRDALHELECCGEISENELFVERPVDFLPLLRHLPTLGWHARLRLVERDMFASEASFTPQALLGWVRHRNCRD